MEPVSLSIRSEEEMRRLGHLLGDCLRAGDFVGLIGELGAGKTVLARGVAEALGVPSEQVTSPTFAIVYTYEGRVPLHHADLYRLADDEELYATGFYDLLSTGAAVVEWIDQVPEAAPDDRLLVRIDRAGEDGRRVTLEPRGVRSVQLTRAVAARYTGAEE